MKRPAFLLPLLLAAAACESASTEPVVASARSTQGASSQDSDSDDDTDARGNTRVVTEESVVRQLEDTPPTNNWVLYTRAGTPPSAGTFEVGPGATPLGVGSFHMQLALGSEKVYLFNYDHVGTALTTITAMSYSTYKHSGGSFPFPSINIQIDRNGGAFVAGDFRTLVFEPYYQPGFVDATGVWQHRDAINGGAAKWWSTGPVSETACRQANPCTWTAMLANFPGATIFGGFGLNAGSGNGGLNSSVDALSISHGGETTTYDFEPSKASCKNGGWMTLTRADGSSFKNQGACVSYISRDDDD